MINYDDEEELINIHKKKKELYIDCWISILTYFFV